MKNQLKKSLSFVMAVLMILSCWVWVAPEKAEAAGAYTVVVTTGSQGNEYPNPAENQHYVNIYDKSGNYKQFNWVNAQDGKTGPEIFEVDYWPAKIGFHIASKNVAAVRITNISINGVEIFADAYNMKCTGAGTDVYVAHKDVVIEAGGTLESWTFSNWKAPYFKSLTEMSATDVDVVKYPSTSVSTSTVTVTGGLDQYGVLYDGTKPGTGYTHTLKYTTNLGDMVSLDSKYARITSASGASPVTVTVYPEIQKLFEVTGSTEIYLESYYNSDTKSVIHTPIMLHFPRYSAYFYPNGGTIGTSKTNNTSDDAKPLEYGNILYGAFIKQLPKYADRSSEGLELDGYYSQKYEPSRALKTHFDEKLKYDPDNSKIDDKGNSHWYAAWKAKTYKATFRVNTNMLGQLDAKHGKAMLDEGMYESVAAINSMLASAYESADKDAIKFENTANFGRAPVFEDNVFVGWRMLKSDGSLLDLQNEVITGDVVFEAVFATRDEAEKKYTTTFYDGNGGIAKQETLPFRSLAKAPVIADKEADVKYTYEFAGWAKNVGKKFYTVDAEGKDETGAFIPYMPYDTAEFVVTEDASYVPVFRMTKIPYKVTFNFRGNIGENYTTQSVVVDGYHYGDHITVPETVKTNYTYNGKRYNLTGWKQGLNEVDIDEITVTGNMSLNPVYDNGADAVYTIKFYDKDNNLIGAEYDDEGNLINATKYEYIHNASVTVPEIPITIETETSRYVFDRWSSEVAVQAKADAEYKAIYDKKDYADISFEKADGTPIYSMSGKENSQFVGDVIPEYDEETYGAPQKNADEIGSYEWVGWEDQNGNEVIPGTTVLTGNTILRPLYEITKHKYTVEFVIPGEEGNPDLVVSKETYEYRDKITVPADADVKKEADDYYTYTFWQWDPAVSENCYGNATYRAVFKKKPIYYTVKWLTDAKNLYRTTRVAYGKKIQQTSTPETERLGAAPTGYTWALKEWIRCNEYGNDILVNGEQIKYSRETLMEKGEMYFYPVYEAVAGKNAVTFGKMVDGEFKAVTTEQINYNALVSDYTPGALEAVGIPKSTDDYHYVFVKWLPVGGGELERNENGEYIITGPVQLYPEFEIEQHTFKAGEIVKAPTCLEKGYAVNECTYEYCTIEPGYIELDRIADESAPEGTVYIGTEKWTMNNYTDGIDYSEDEMVYVNAGSSTIVNAVDIGTRGKNNPEAKLSRGVGKIEYAVVNVDDIENFATFNPHTDISEGWTTIYNYENIYNSVLEAVLANNGKKLSDYNNLEDALKNKIDSEVKAVLAGYNANATGILGGLNLENGNEYVIYLRLSDIEINGDVNISYMSTGRLHYGTEAAKITLSGEGYGTKFCEAVTIKITDDTEGFEAYIDGEKQNITVTSTGVISATFTNNKVGVHTLTVVDKNGNKSTKSFEIKNGHSYRNYTVAATCENEGSRYNLCTVCGTKNDVVALPAKGHSFTDNYTEIAPTCIVDGTRTYVCDNNCGEKLTVGPASGEDELKAVGITSADTLKHLLATKTHTYAKVLDDNGKETSQDAWVIDKAATCMVKGSKHKDCIVCGAREIEPIEKDTENGHKFYRARVEDGDEATCVKDGIKSETCRYCSYERTVDTIPALGHTEGEYVVTLAPTCTTEGSKVLKCTECDATLGEAVVVPATGHKLVAKDVPFQGEGTDTKWYQIFECVTDGCDYEVTKEVEHEEEAKGTVIFKNEDATVATFADETVGETILASDVAVPTKTSDVDYKYTFSHWATRTGEGTEESPYEYTAVKFPITVEEGSATYYAVFAKKNIKYTVTYYYDDQITQYKKVGYLNNAAEHKLEEGPEKAATVSKTYKFVGWGEKVEKVVTEEVKDADGNPTTVEKTVTEIVPVEGDTVKINGKNIVLYAVYAASDRCYSVTYADGSGEFIETFYVKANTKARACAIEPEKDADSKYHYTFKSWNRSNQLSNVKSNIYASPEFTAVSHTYPVENRVIKTAATCTENAVYTYKCSCGRSYDKEEPGSAIGHSWGEAKYDETTGKNTVTCQIEGCGATEVDTRTFTFKFYLEEPADENAKTYDDVNNIYWGSTVDSTRLPADPEKDANEQYTYEFKGWKIKGDETGTLLSSADIAKLKVTKDYIFVADFDEIERVFKVIFAYEHSRKAIQVLTVKYGESAVFTEATPEKSKDTDPGYKPKLNHYTFKGWSADTSSITEDLIVYAKFEEEAHSYTLSDTIGEATCEKGAGYVFTCSGCGDSYEDTGKALGHDLKEVGVEEGYIIYKCTRCDHTESKPVDAPEEDEEEVVTKAMATVTVLRGDEKVSGIKVIIQPLGEDAPVIGTTNAYGVASFEIDKSKTYVAWVEIEGEKLPVSLSVGADGNISGVYTIEVADNNGNGSCGCACHRNNVWGAIFRFFHKIIKLFTGEFKCCANPDPMYG